MKFREDKKSAYLSGYQELSLNDKLIKKSTTKWKSDWEESGEKSLHNYSDDLIRSGKMYTNTEKLFRYSLNSVETMYEDPTWLGFKILFDSVNSPLFNYGDFPPSAIEEPVVEPKLSRMETLPVVRPLPDTTDPFANYEKKDITTNLTQPPDSTTNITEKTAEKTAAEKAASELQTAKTEYSNAPYVSSSALAFIKRYGYKIPEIQKRESIYFEFVKNLDVLFNRTNKDGGYTKDYYIDQISGLDKLAAKMVKYDDFKGDKITIQLTEDISLRSAYLAELYNNLIYSYKNQRYLIPENCLRFDMDISITDMRIFKYLTNESDVLTENINTDPPRITYTLHDCNFDFSNSIPFQPTMVVGGRAQGAPSAFSVLSFDIKYKSISKNFRTSLVRGSLEISNKLDQLVNSQILTKSEVYKHDIKSQYELNKKQEQDTFSNSESTASEKEVAKETYFNRTNPNEIDYVEDTDDVISIKRKKDILEKYNQNPILFDQEGHPDHVRGDTNESAAKHDHSGYEWDKLQTTLFKDGIGDDLDGEGTGGSKNLDFFRTLNKKPSVKERLSDFGKGLGNQLLDSVLDNLGDYVDKLKAKYNDIRGQLLKEMLRQIREPLNMPRIYPDNVYSTDFRTLSLETFARGLGSDLLNDALDAVSGGLLGGSNI
jgi:hypothetical protein